MALTNAERQKRHRERVKAKLGGAAQTALPVGNDDPDMLDLINAHYAAGFKSVAEKTPDSQARNDAINSFAALPRLSWIDVLDLVQAAGADAWVQQFEKAAIEWAATLPHPAPEPKQKTKRGRKNVT